MTVKELIEALQQYPQDANVELEYDTFCGGSDLDAEDILYIEETSPETWGRVLENTVYFCCSMQDEMKDILNSENVEKYRFHKEELD